jgi:hypothetical protein
MAFAPGETQNAAGLSYPANSSFKMQILLENSDDFIGDLSCNRLPFLL